jgi:type I restriction enzyme S subunit
VNQDKYDPSFVYYLLKTKTDVIQSVANSATTPIVNKSTFASINVCVPPLPTQRAIATFLDRKTGQIDELIRIKEQQTELLQEQRTALINQVVTKGLDPNVEMKPSGVEWIAEIPAHWNLSMLKYAARLVYGDTLISENREDGVVPVYGSNGIIDTHSAANTLSPAIIVGRKGSLGKIQYSDVPCFVIDTAYYIDSRTSHVNLRWLYYVLQALKLERFRNSVLPGLNRESAESQYIPLITEEEQTQIANFLDCKTEQIDELIAAEQRKIELLKEYRQSLISEAVTGKIDVRNEV